MPHSPVNWRALPATLTCPETARLARIRVARIRELVREGKLPAVPYTGPGTGTRTLIATERLREWLAKSQP